MGMERIGLCGAMDARERIRPSAAPSGYLLGAAQNKNDVKSR
jgi:hypothetical protein